MTKDTSLQEIRPDPRQEAFMGAYYSPESATFSNAYQSALSVGYSHSTAKDILYDRPLWFREKQGVTTGVERDVLLRRLADIIDDNSVGTRDKLKAIELMMRHYGMLTNKVQLQQTFSIQDVL